MMACEATIAAKMEIMRPGQKQPGGRVKKNGFAKLDGFLLILAAGETRL